MATAPLERAIEELDTAGEARVTFVVVTGTKLVDQLPTTFHEVLEDPVHVDSVLGESNAKAGNVIAKLKAKEAFLTDRELNLAFIRH